MDEEPDYSKFKYVEDFEPVEKSSMPAKVLYARKSTDDPSINSGSS